MQLRVKLLELMLNCDQRPGGSAAFRITGEWKHLMLVTQRNTILCVKLALLSVFNRRRFSCSVRRYGNKNSGKMPVWVGHGANRAVMFST